MTKDELWQAVLGEIEISLSKASFTTWFKNTTVLDLMEKEIIIGVPNIFSKEWLEKKYQKIILDSVRKYYPKINRVSCVIGNKNNHQSQVKLEVKKIDSIVNNVFNKEKNNSQYSNNISSINPNFDSNLNPKYRFENYIVGSNNDLAYAACRSVAENPGKNYNPLFIYGGVGLGKTHLLQSVGNFAVKNNPSIRVRYISMERFANEFLDSVQTSKIKEFKNKYIQLDILIVDDVQFLSGKEKTQEEFFHIFESLYQHGKQIILSSDRPPKSIQTLEDRLRSRFEGGMMADINKPDLETRIIIIKRKLEEKSFSLSDDIIEYLANNIYHNIRELEGALNKIIATYQLRNTIPTLKDVIRETEDLVSSNRRQDLSPEKIIGAVADFFNVKSEEITGRCRNKKIIRPRQVAIFLLRNEINLSFPEIGNLIGGRDHSTAIYACEKITLELKTNKVLSNHIKFIREKFIDY